MFNKVLKNIEEIGHTNIFLIFVLALIVFYPLLKIGFTTRDDAYFAISALNSNVLEVTKMLSVNTGRIGFLWGMPLFMAPYILGLKTWYFIMKIGSFFILLGTLYYSLLKIFKSKFIAFSSLLFYLAFIQNGWDYNVFTSYSFAFNFYVVLLFSSFYLFTEAIERKKIILAIISGILYFFTFGIELFVLFLPIYFVILLSRLEEGESIKKGLKIYKNYILSIVFPWIFYLIIYLIWRHIFPSNYDGNTINSFNLLPAIKVITTYSLSAFPFLSFDFFFSAKEQLLFMSSVGLRVIISEINISDIIKPLVVGFLFIKLIISSHLFFLKEKMILWGILFSGINIFIPNILLGFISRHQEWVANGVHTYVYTYYSFIFSVIFLALLFTYINLKICLWNSLVRKSIISIMVLVIMFISLTVAIRNKYIAFDQILEHRKWELMDIVISSEAFAEIPTGSVIVAPTLFVQRNTSAIFPEDWVSYVKYKTNKDIIISNNDTCKEKIKCYTLIFNQLEHSDEQFIVLGERDIDSYFSSNITIYSMPIKTDTMIVGSFKNLNVPPIIKVNNITVENIGQKSFSFNIKKNHSDDIFQTINIVGNVGIFIEDIFLLHSQVELNFLSFSEELKKGIDFTKKYPSFIFNVIGMSELEEWGRWSDASLSKTVKFYFKEMLPSNFVLEVNAIGFGPNINTPVKVKIGNIEKTFIVTNNKEDVHKLHFQTNGNINMIEFIPINPISPNEIYIKNSDKRKLGIGFISLKIKND